MSAKAILEELKSLGKESYRKVLLNHGASEPCFGVKIEELKRIRKRTGKDHALALALFDSSVYDAMYLAGLMADDARMTRKDLQRWAKNACAPLAGSTVPWVAAGSPHGWDLALEWIDSKQDLVAVAGWATLGGLVAVKSDSELDLPELKRLLERVHRSIQNAPDVVRYHMNSFVIAVGCHVAPLTKTAVQIGNALGRLTVDMGNTACQVPFAPDYIRKVEQRGTLGRKRKSAKF